jgi:hypothetical protein
MGSSYSFVFFFQAVAAIPFGIVASVIASRARGRIYPTWVGASGFFILASIVVAPLSLFTFGFVLPGSPIGLFTLLALGGAMIWLPLSICSAVAFCAVFVTRQPRDSVAACQGQL